MAIDTAGKRASVLGIIIPDGTLDQGDRQTILDIYRGILAGTGLPTGLVTVAFSARAPGAAFSGAAPGVAFGGARPGITFTEG